MKDNWFKYIVLSILGVMLLLVLIKLFIDYKFIDYKKVIKVDNVLEITFLEGRDGINNLNIDNLEAARNRNDNYITFTVHNLTKNEVKYKIISIYGKNVEGKERYQDNYVHFDLVEIMSSAELKLLENANYDAINNLELHTDSINQKDKKYQLRVWLSDSFAQNDNNYANIQLSFKIIVDKDELTKEEKVEIPMRASEKVLDSLNSLGNCSNVFYEEDGIKYLFGNIGCINNNYVWYSGKLWRIVAIYPDGALKLVTDVFSGYIGYGPIFVKSNHFSSSGLYQWLNEDFLDTLYNHEKIIDTSKEWYYNNHAKVSCVSSTDCKLDSSKDNNSSVRANVGVLSSYEFYSILWNTMKSYSYFDASYLGGGHGLFIDDGRVMSGEDKLGGVRPAINIRSDIEFVGKGTYDNPYRITIDKETGKTGDLINSRLNGEFVTLDNHLYRIIETEDNTTKLVSNEQIRLDSNTNFYTGELTYHQGENGYYGYCVNGDCEAKLNIYGSGVAKGPGTFHYYLNNDWLSDLKNYVGDLFTYGTYYYGIVMKSNDVVSNNNSDENDQHYYYKMAVCKGNKNSSNLKRKVSECEKVSEQGQNLVGFPRIGEVYNVAQKTILVTRSDYKDGTWFIQGVTDLGTNTVSEFYPIQAQGGKITLVTLNLKSEVKIKSGAGTSLSPYVVGL